MRYFSLAAAAAVVGLVATGPGEAAQYVFTITGTVDASSSYDGMDLFDHDPTASEFTATFFVEDALPNALYAQFPTSSSGVGGGQVLDWSSPPVSATLTIGARRSHSPG